MAALTRDRNTPMKGSARIISVPVAASTQIFKGSIVASNIAGFLVPANDAAGLVVMGVADKNCDNTSGANGDIECVVTKGVAGLRADGVAPTQADVGRTVYVQDDGNITTAASATNEIPVGNLDSIDGSFFFTHLVDQVGTALADLVEYTNTNRPDASSVPAGTHIFNTDDNAPNYSDGTDWFDSDGNLT